MTPKEKEETKAMVEEVKRKEESSSEKFIFGCNLHNKTGRGCAIYVKNNVQANPVEFSSKFQESVWISVKLEGGDELLVGCIYRSNSGTDENNECLLKLLNEVNDAKYSHVLTSEIIKSRFN